MNKKTYKVESEFDHNGLKCVVIMTHMGHRCGYVGIPKSHVLYGLGSSDNSPYLSKNKLMDQEVGKRGVMPIMVMAFEDGNLDEARPDYYFDVHGGITYSGGGINSEYPIESDLWWFGYDTGHYNDGKDLGMALEYGIIEKEYYDRVMETERMYPLGGIVRTLDYCMDECKNLAEQLSEI